MTRFALAVLVAACGRIGFEPVSNDASPGLPIVGCEPPQRPDTSGGMAVACDETALRSAVAAGGPMYLDCSPDATITVTAEIAITMDTVLDARGVRFDGQQAMRIFRVVSGSFTLLEAQFADAYSATNGGAIYVEGGALAVYGSTFSGNRAGMVTGGIGGGAIASTTTSTLAVYDSTFEDNAAPNGGAIEAHGDLSIARSSFARNNASGTGAGQGGAGGAINASGTGDVTMCGVRFNLNSSGEFSGAIHRVSTNDTGIDRWEKVNFDSNVSATAGASYVQGVVLTLSQASFAGNNSGLVGGLWVNSKVLQAENVSFIDNLSTGGLGGGLRLEASAGRIAFATIANNRAACPTCWAAAIEGGQNVTLVSSVIANNAADATGVPASCRLSLVDGGGTLQWPNETPLCSASAAVVDPLLGPLAPATGPAGTYLVRVPQAGSPAIGATTSCPAEDALGNPRPVPCTAGAVEP